jgi:hypothetical protein
MTTAVLNKVAESRRESDTAIEALRKLVHKACAVAGAHNNCPFFHTEGHNDTVSCESCPHKQKECTDVDSPTT